MIPEQDSELQRWELLMLSNNMKFAFQIYADRKRKREREGDLNNEKSVIYIYIYIYLRVYIYSPILLNYNRAFEY